MILEMGCKLRILSLKFQLKLHNLLFMVRPSPHPPPFSNEPEAFPGLMASPGLKQGLYSQHIKVGHSMLCFSSTSKTKSTIYVSFCLSWTIVRGLQPLLWFLMCENKRIHPTKAIYTLITTQNIKVRHSMVWFSSTTKTKSTVYVSLCLSWTMVRGLRPLVFILMCENKSFHPTSLSH
jgi:hypothetical protein